MEYTFYALYSEKFNKIYIGFTSNLEERFKSRNELGIKNQTTQFRPWVIVYTEILKTKSEAMKRE